MKPELRVAEAAVRVEVPLSLGWSEEEQRKRWLQVAAMAVVALFGTVALVNGLVGDPCRWARSYARCLELPFSEQVTNNLGAPLFFLGLAALGFGEIGVAFFRARTARTLEVEATATRVRVVVGGKTVFDQSRTDTHLQAEGSRLVLACASDGERSTWTTACSPTELRPTLDALTTGQNEALARR